MAWPKDRPGAKVLRELSLGQKAAALALGSKVSKEAYVFALKVCNEIDRAQLRIFKETKVLHDSQEAYHAHADFYRQVARALDRMTDVGLADCLARFVDTYYKSGPSRSLPTKAQALRYLRDTGLGLLSKDPCDARKQLRRAERYLGISLPSARRWAPIQSFLDLSTDASVTQRVKSAHEANNHERPGGGARAAPNGA